MTYHFFFQLFFMRFSPWSYTRHREWNYCQSHPQKVCYQHVQAYLANDTALYLAVWQSEARKNWSMSHHFSVWPQDVYNHKLWAWQLCLELSICLGLSWCFVMTGHVAGVSVILSYSVTSLGSLLRGWAEHLTTPQELTSNTIFHWAETIRVGSSNTKVQVLWDGLP